MMKQKQKQMLRHRISFWELCAVFIDLRWSKLHSALRKAIFFSFWIYVSTKHCLTSASTTLERTRSNLLPFGLNSAASLPTTLCRMPLVMTWNILKPRFCPALPKAKKPQELFPEIPPHHLISESLHSSCPLTQAKSLCSVTAPQTSTWNSGGTKHWECPGLDFSTGVPSIPFASKHAIHVSIP